MGGGMRPTMEVLYQLSYIGFVLRENKADGNAFIRVNQSTKIAMHPAVDFVGYYNGMTSA